MARHVSRRQRYVDGGERQRLLGAGGRAARRGSHTRQQSTGPRLLGARWRWPSHSALDRSGACRRRPVRRDRRRAGLALRGAQRRARAVGRARGRRCRCRGGHRLPACSLGACGVVLWLLGDIGLASLLFVVPIGVAALLLSWRSGATFAALAVATFAALNALRLGPVVGEWVPQTLALAGVASLFAVCVGIFSAQLTEIIVSLSPRFTQLHDQRAAQGQEQARLLEGLNLLEEAQARLEQERAAVNAQISELADAARRMTEGDLAAARGLHPGMYGPLDILAAALVRLSQQMASALSARQQVAVRQYALDSLNAATRAPDQLLAPVY